MALLNGCPPVKVIVNQQVSVIDVKRFMYKSSERCPAQRFSNGLCWLRISSLLTLNGPTNEEIEGLASLPVSVSIGPQESALLAR